MIADYSVSEITPTPAEPELTKPAEEIVITYNGSNPTIRVGSQKVFTANLAEDNYFDVSWKLFDGTNTYGGGYDNTTNTYGDYTMITTDRTLTLKVARNYDLVGTVLTITAEGADGNVGNIMAEVIS
jgi:hypothetical protein